MVFPVTDNKADNKESSDEPRSPAPSGDVDPEDVWTLRGKKKPHQGEELRLRDGTLVSDLMQP